MIDFESVFIRLDEIGFSDVLLPFLLIFSVVYAVLTQIMIFGAKGKNTNMIIALVMGLLVVIPHVTGTYPPGSDIVEIINTAIPNISVVVIGIIMVMLLIGVFGVRIDLLKGEGLFKSLIPLICVGLVFFIFGRAAGWFDFGIPNWLSFLNDPDFISVALVVLVFVIIISFVTGGDGGVGKFGGYLKGAIEEFGKILR